jgi:hypothetical protein
VATGVVAKARKPAVQRVLLGLGGHPATKATLARGCIEGFVAVSDSGYDDIRAMLAAIHAAGYTTLR